MNKTFEQRVQEDLHQFLIRQGMIEDRMPQCPDVEGRWADVGEAYLPDGMREFRGYPVVSLGWMMLLGMAVARFWDNNWEKYAGMKDLYSPLRNARGFDFMDEHILEDILRQDEPTRQATGALVSECAARALSLLRHEPIEPGSAEAFQAYVACLHQLYLMGMAVQLKAMGYKMTLI